MIEFDEYEVFKFLSDVHTSRPYVRANEDLDLCEFCGWTAKPGGFNAHLYQVFEEAKKGRLI